MKKIVFILSTIAIASTLSAADFWFTPNSSSYPVWRSDLWQSWSTSTDDGKTLIASTQEIGAPTATDNVTYDYANMGANVTNKWQIQNNITVNDFTIKGIDNSIAGFIKTVDTAEATTTSLTIKGNFNKIHDSAVSNWNSFYFQSGTNNKFELIIEGNALFTRTDTSGGANLFAFGGMDSYNALGKLIVKGNFNTTGSSQIAIRNVYSGRDAEKIAQDKYYYYKNADVQIGGKLSTDNGGTIFLNSQGVNPMIISCNGLGSGDFRSNNNNMGNPGATTTLVLSNTSNTSFYGTLTDLYAYGTDEGLKGSNIVLDVVMMGSAQQKLVVSNKRAFRGGVTVISGELLMKTNYANDTSTWGKWGDIRMVGNSEGKSAKFGAIGNNGTSSDADAFVYADNLVWSDGIIVTGIIDATTASLINLTGTMKKGESAANEFWFEFTGNTSFLYNDENAKFKVVAWSEGNTPTEFNESDFKALSVDGKEAVFSIENDGLYVSYKQIPEPATLAIILASLSLFLGFKKSKIRLIK